MTTFLSVSRFTILLIVIMLTACAALPVQEMSDARQALEAAGAAQAQEHAAEDYEKAKSMLRQAETEWAAGDYEAAQHSAEKAKEYALIARQKATRPRQSE